MNDFGKSYHEDRKIEDKHYMVTNHLLSLIPNINSAYEVGCGLGFWIHALRYYGVNAEGYDISEYCKINAYDLAKGFVSNELSNKSYDLVLSMDVLEHLRV